MSTPRELEQDHAEVWDEWLASGDQTAWLAVADDGLSEPEEDPDGPSPTVTP